MARTASMSAAEAEAAIGARGSITVDGANRGTVRKWFVAQGMPALFVGGLAMREMEAAYNDTSDKALDRLRGKLAEARDANADLVESALATETETSAAAIETATRGNGHDDNAAKLIETMRAVLGNGAAIDENRVREILRAELPSLIPVTRLEIQTQNGVKDHGVKPRHKLLPRLIRALSAGMNVALVGPAGSGKTTAAEQAAEILEHVFYIQGAVQGAHELLGYKDAHGVYHTTPFRQAFEHGGTICLDELDAGDAAGMLVCNSALANCYMPFPDRAEPVKKHETFRLVACLNTYGNGADRVYVGRTQMDAATLDRFYFLDWRYDETLERILAGNDAWVDRVQALRRGAEKEKARVVISPRASIFGARALAAGDAWGEAEDSLIWRGVDSELRRRIEAQA
jgi:energy-coupling factor transporter ATP-binding protein EcfA2